MYQNSSRYQGQGEAGYLSNAQDQTLLPNSRASSPVGGHTTEKSSTDVTQAANLPGASTDINILTSAVLALQQQVHILTVKVQDSISKPTANPAMDDIINNTNLSNSFIQQETNLPSLHNYTTL